VARPRIVDEPRVPTAVRLPTSLHDRLSGAARERDVSVNLLVNRAIQAYLDQLPPVEEVAP
jgi:predicted HicB family RNase H-like nuclease